MWCRRLFRLPHHPSERGARDAGQAQALGDHRHGGATGRERGGIHKHDLWRSRSRKARVHIVFKPRHRPHARRHCLHGRCGASRRVCERAARRSRLRNHPALSERLSASHTRWRQWRLQRHCPCPQLGSGDGRFHGPCLHLGVPLPQPRNDS